MSGGSRGARPVENTALRSVAAAGGLGLVCHRRPCSQARSCHPTRLLTDAELLLGKKWVTVATQVGGQSASSWSSGHGYGGSCPEDGNVWST